MSSRWLLLCLVALGCSDGAAPSRINSARAAKEAMAQLDTNKDGQLSSAELEACPPLKSALAAYDTNRDKSISEEELRNRLQSLVDTNVGEMSFSIVVNLNGRPLSGAKITMTPVSFLKDVIGPAEGTTDIGGQAGMSKAKNDPTVQYGLYLIQVSKHAGPGQEMLPARYNTQTTLGCEVGKDNRGQPVVLNLKSP